MDTARYQQDRWELINGPMALRRNLRINADGEVYRPERGPIISDSPPWVAGLVGGVHDAVRGVFSLGGELNDVLGGGVLYWDEAGFHVEKKRRLDDSGKPLPYFNLAEAEHQSDSMTESIIRGFSQFFAGLAFTRGAGLGMGAMVGRSAVSDFLFDPVHGGLSNWLQDLGVASKTPVISDVIDYLAVDVEEEDSAWEKLKGRFKLALEGALIGIPIDSVMVAFRALRNNPESREKVLDNLVQGLKEFTSETGGSVPRRRNLRANTQDSTPEDDGIARFRSGLLPMLADLPNQASGEQMLTTLSNPQRLGKYGAKAEEIELLGLDDYLTERGSDVVTKAEVEKYIQDNQIKLETDVTGGGSGWISDQEIDWDAGGDADADAVIGNLEGLQEGRLGLGVVRGYLGDSDEITNIDIVQTTDLSNWDEMDGVANDLRLLVENDEMFYVNNVNPSAADPETRILNPEISSRLDKLNDKVRYEARTKDVTSASDDLLKKDNAVILQELGELISNVDIHNSLMRGAEYNIYSEGGTLISTTRNETEALHQAMGWITEDEGTIWSSITYPVKTTGDNVDDLAGETMKEMNYKEGKILMPKGEEDSRWATREELEGVRGHKIGEDRSTDQRVFSWFRSTNRALHILNDDGSTTNVGDGMFTEEFQSDLVQRSKGRWKPKDLTRSDTKREFESFLQPKVVQIHKQIVDWLEHVDLHGATEGTRTADWSSADLLMIADDTRRGDGASGAVFNASGEEHIRFLMSDIIAHVTEIGQPREISGGGGGLTVSLPFIEGRLKAIADGEAVRYRTVGPGASTETSGGQQSPEWLRWRRLAIPKVAELLDPEDVLQLIKLNDQHTLALHGTPDVPMRRNWEEITIKRAIIEGVNDGLKYIAFPSTIDTVAAIEKHMPSDAIAKRYTTTTPKILKKLAKRYNAKIHTGVIDGSPAHEWATMDKKAKQLVYPEEMFSKLSRGQEDGMVIILELTDTATTKIKKEGFALPSVIIAGGAGAAATQQAAEQQNGI